MGAIGVTPRTPATLVTPRTPATLRGHKRETGMCPPDGARSRPGQHGAVKSLVDMVVCLASRSVVEADSGTDRRPRDHRVSEWVELEGRVGREQYVATSELSMAEGHECPPILDRESVECVYRFRTRRWCRDLLFGPMSWLRQDRGLCPFACST
jgi:hypothetical protein